MSKSKKASTNNISLKKNKSTKKETSTISVLPTIGIILALTAATLFFFNDTSNILKHVIEDKEELNLILNSIKIVSLNFIGINAILLILEWVLYKYNCKKMLYILVIAIIVIASIGLYPAYITLLLTPSIVGIYYSIKTLNKEF